MSVKTLLFSLSLCGLVLFSRAAEDLGPIERWGQSIGFSRPIPVFVSGYSGEIDKTLRFDLTFSGFTVVSDRNTAQYHIQKNNAAGVGAQVTDLLQNKIPYNKAFNGGSPRHQTHALVDDLAQTFAKLPGITQTRVAFVVQAGSYGVGEVYVSDYDGFNAAAVTRDNVIVHSPAWAGKNALFYQSFRLGKGDILSHDLGTGARKPFARYPGLNASPAVSPDGRRVAMILSKSGSPDLWVADIDGGNLRQLTTTKEDESSPCWSPDGTRICFASRMSGKPALYTVPAAGGKMSALAVGAPSPTEPDWSPDGKYIVFTAQTGAGFQVYLAPLEGPARNRSIPLVAGQDPVWAPNSRTVIYARTVNHRRILALLDVATKQTKDIAPINGSASEPSWAR